jgi:hypothetical protein
VIRIGEAIAVAHSAANGSELAQEVYCRDGVATGRHYNADIEQPALDMSLARGGHCPVRIDCYQLLAESGGAMIAPHGT